MDEPRSEQNLTADERTQLEAFLDDNRDELVACVEGLTDEQARRRLVPSLTTPLGLLKHAVFVEKAWFHCSLGGSTRPEAGIPETVDESFELDDDDTVAGLVEEYRRACDEARTIAASYSLDDLAVHNRRGPLSLRWIYVHMIEELARHAGHADILREQILAADGSASAGHEAGHEAG
ncbi:MAG TPA: DinB family protein [Marmoricola sp.]